MGPGQLGQASAPTNRPRSVSVAITTSAGSSTKGATNWWKRAGDAVDPFGQPGLGQATPFLVLDMRRSPAVHT